MRVAISWCLSGPAQNPDRRLALVVHELATNSLKYGALSVTSGTLDISGTSMDTEVCVVWTERGGSAGRSPRGRGLWHQAAPSKRDRPTREFHQNDWSDDGIIVTLTMNAAKPHDQ